MVTTRSQRKRKRKDTETSFTDESLSSGSDDTESLISIDSDDVEDEEGWVALLDDPDFLVEDGEDGEAATVTLNYAGLIKLLRKTNPSAASNLGDALRVIEGRTPTFMDILVEDVETEHRVKLIELYEALKELQSASENGTPCRLEYFALRDRIRTLTRKFKRRKVLKDKMSDEARKNLELSRKLMEETESEAHASLETTILSLNTTVSNKAAIFRKYKRMESLHDSDDEKAKLNNWLYWATRMPHNNIRVSDTSDISSKLREVAFGLEKELCGMQPVKEQILTFFNTRLANPDSTGDMLALIGPPGTGKTSIARLLASVLDVSFAQISFGGVKDASYLKGHDYTYVGSQPGQIAKCLAHMGSKNGIIFMDEFEKVSSDKNIVASLLHIVDRQQNSEYRDNYLGDLTIDLSNIWFICSMNGTPKDSALRDRLFQVKVPGYTQSDKVEILRKHSIPRALTNSGLDSDSILYTDEVLAYIVSKVSPEKSGVRSIENAVSEIIRKVSFLVRVGSDHDNYPFKVSFVQEQTLSFPVTLTKKLVDSLVTRVSFGDFDTPPHGMYM